MSVLVLNGSEVDRLLRVVEGRSAVRSGHLREIREQLQLSQRELARVLGADESTVSRWETGDRLPREDAADRIGRLLAVLEEAAS